MVIFWLLLSDLVCMLAIVLTLLLSFLLDILMIIFRLLCDFVRSSLFLCSFVLLFHIISYLTIDALCKMNIDAKEVFLADSTFYFPLIWSTRFWRVVEHSASRFVPQMVVDRLLVWHSTSKALLNWGVRPYTLKVVLINQDHCHRIWWARLVMLMAANSVPGMLTCCCSRCHKDVFFQVKCGSFYEDIFSPSSIALHQFTATVPCDWWMFPWFSIALNVDVFWNLKTWMVYGYHVNKIHNGTSELIMLNSSLCHSDW